MNASLNKKKKKKEGKEKEYKRIGETHGFSQS
jgi:hypothetical protein